MGLTYVEVLNEINMAQVFLWLQEKSLFGEGSLLHNPSPGVDFTGADLVRPQIRISTKRHNEHIISFFQIRNVILVSVLDLSMREQVEFYKNNWLDPIENVVAAGGGGPKELSGRLNQFVDRELKEIVSGSTTYVG